MPLPTTPKTASPPLAAVVSALLGAALLAGDSAAAAPAVAVRDAPTGWPTRFAWSWDRHEDLRFLRPGEGVAPVVVSLELTGDRVDVRPLRDSLLLPAAAAVLPVVHVEATRAMHAALTPAQRDRLVDAIAQAAARTHDDAVQVDFEALPSQRPFYRAVLQQLRARRPSTWISVTALASWCLDDRWVASLPVDEVVAMAFRMGASEADTAGYRRLVATTPAWREARCTASGVATDEPLARVPHGTRLYLFSPLAWTPARWVEQTHHYAGSP